MAQQKFLIIGASGTVGSEIVRILKAGGHAVRVTTSKPVVAKTVDGVEQVQLNVATGVGIREAFDGVTRAFLLSPPGYADHHAVLSPLIQEAKRRGLEKVVLMTAMGANAVETAPFRRAEIELEKSGLRYNIIRPNWFLQNFNTLWTQGVRDGKVALPAGQAKVSFIDARDISAVAAQLLVNDALTNRDFDLSGPEAVDHDQVVAAISNVTGKKVVYENLKPEIMLQGMLKAGLPADYAEFLIMIFGFLREGYNAKTTDSVQTIIGRAPRSLATYAADFKASWL